MRDKQLDAHSVHAGTSRRKGERRKRYWRRQMRRALATMRRRWEAAA